MLLLVDVVAVGDVGRVVLLRNVQCRQQRYARRERRPGRRSVPLTGMMMICCCTAC